MLEVSTKPGGGSRCKILLISGHFKVSADLEVGDGPFAPVYFLFRAVSLLGSEILSFANGLSHVTKLRSYRPCLVHEHIQMRGKIIRKLLMSGTRSST
jgi:hypothetical protein